MTSDFASILYLIASVLFILSLKGLSSPSSARMGNIYGISGMAIAVATTLVGGEISNYFLIILAIAIGGTIGTIIAKKIEMTAMPQLVAGFHSLVGMAAVFVALAALYSPESFGIMGVKGLKTASLIEMSIGVVVGAITFSGSVIAFAKLQGIMKSSPVRFTNQHKLNAIIGGSIILLLIIFCITEVNFLFWLMILLAFALGFLLIIPIGGADMPVVVSMLNSYSGWAAAGIGFTLGNSMLIITGALVGSSGAILSYIMCKAMNRSIFNVIFGGFSDSGSAAISEKGEERPVKAGSSEDAAYILKAASSVIIVPGYGMAVAQAQHAVKELVERLEHEGISVRFAIHPVAGRMPGHMNVLLAEANISYDKVFELEEINNDFSSCDVAFVIGANDITNPAAKDNPASPIYGMPILDVAHAKTVLFIKRGMAAGYAGIENDLFYRENTMMLFGDAKKMTEEIVKGL